MVLGVDRGNVLALILRGALPLIAIGLLLGSAVRLWPAAASWGISSLEQVNTIR